MMAGNEIDVGILGVAVAMNCYDHASLVEFAIVE